MTTLSEIKRHNKSKGRHFFDRGNPPVVSKQGNYLVTGGFGGGFTVYKYDRKTGHIKHIENPYGAYSWQPHKTKRDAVNYAKHLAKRKK